MRRQWLLVIQMLTTGVQTEMLIEDVACQRKKTSVEPIETRWTRGFERSELFMTMLPITYHIWDERTIGIEKSMVRRQVECGTLMRLYDICLEVYGVEVVKEIGARLKCFPAITPLAGKP
jgi:hypothetical protein